jgi:lycopene cyclase domain-containing protein
MNYLVFHLVFLIPPLLLLLLRRRGRGGVHPREALLLGAIAAIALVYTTPWDNYLVWSGVWSYGQDRVLGTIGYVPVEEYLFFLLQPLLAGLWLYEVLATAPPGSPGAAPMRRDTRARVGGTLVYAATAAAGVVLLQRGGDAGTYLGLILAWAAPVLTLQWVYAGPLIWHQRRALLLGVAVPTIYLCFADAVAIHLGIWTISEHHTLGAAFGPLPLEEAVFFLVTTLLVVQGLLLFLGSPGPVSDGATRSGAVAREAAV